MGDTETAKGRMLAEPLAVLTGGLLLAIVNPFPDSDVRAWDRIELVIICIGGLALWAWWYSSSANTREERIGQEQTFRKERAGMAFACFFLGALFFRNAWQPQSQQPDEAARPGIEEIVVDAGQDTAISMRVGSVLLGLYWTALGGWYFRTSDVWRARRPLIVLGAAAVLGLLVVWWLAV